MYKVCVIFGGPSVEHEISIISALQAIENIDRSKYEVIPLYISKDKKWYCEEEFLDINTFKTSLNMNKYAEVRLENIASEFQIVSTQKKIFSKTKTIKIDIVLPIVHGTFVEDGTLQGYLDTIGIAYAGPSVQSGVVGQDKAFMKDIFKANGINQMKYKWYYKSQELSEICADIKQNIGTNVIIKPAELGSSVGIGIANDEVTLLNAVEEAFEYTTKIVVEQLLEDFMEVNVSVLGNYKKQKISVTEQVVKNDEILSYEDKYMSSSKNKSNGMASLSRIIPANLHQDMIKKINIIAAKTFKVLNCSGVIRIDLMILGDQIYVNEVNNIPGSLSYYLWEKSEMQYQDLINELLELAIEKHFEKQNTIFSIDSNVLNMTGKKIK